MSTRSGPRAFVALTLVASFCPLAACREKGGKFSEERNVTMKTAATKEEEAAGRRMKFDNELLAKIDEAITRLKDDETADVSATTTEIVALIEQLPQTMDAQKITEQGQVMEARMDQVISYTRRPERRAPLGQLKKEIHQAFERAMREAGKPR